MARKKPTIESLAIENAILRDEAAKARADVDRCQLSEYMRVLALYESAERRAINAEKNARLSANRLAEVMEISRQMSKSNDNMAEALEFMSNKYKYKCWTPAFMFRRGALFAIKHARITGDSAAGVLGVDWYNL